MLDKNSQSLILCPNYNFAFVIVVLHILLSLCFLPFFKAAKDGNVELENKKLEKESKNEQEREKKENMTKEIPSTNSASQITVKGLSNLGNTCFFNAVMQVPMLILFPSSKILFPHIIGCFCILFTFSINFFPPSNSFLGF